MDPTEKKEKKKMSRENLIELLIVILLGIAALLTAWASWISSLHGGNQSTNYTTSNNLSAEGNSEYNAGMQNLMQDMLLWNDISDLQSEILFAQDNGDTQTVDVDCFKLYFKANDNFSEALAAKVGWDTSGYAEGTDPTTIVLDWMEKDEALVSPFYDEAFCNSYLDTANALLAQSQEALEQGKQDNANGDAFGLTTVLFSIVLFLLGICGTMKNEKYKEVIVIVSAVVLILAAIYMLTIPLPTGFSLASFFSHAS